MAVAEVIKQGKKPVFHFLCPLCGHEWKEYYLEGSAMITVESAVHKNFEKQFQASMQCPCCGLAVWSDMRGKVTEEENDG